MKIVRDEEGEHRCAQSEVDQIPSKTVGRLLYRSAGTLGIFDRFNDLSEGCLFPKTFCADLKRTRLIDRARVDIASSCLSLGIGSPVIAAWSTYEWPLRTRPSTGILLPGRMTTTSPGRMAFVSTSMIWFSRGTHAV